MDIGPMELLIVLGIVVLLFGPGKIAGVGGAIGNSVREFRKAVRPDEDAPPETSVAPTPAPGATYTAVQPLLPPPSAEYVPGRTEEPAVRPH